MSSEYAGIELSRSREANDMLSTNMGVEIAAITTQIAVVYPVRKRWPKMRWLHDALVDLGHDVRHVQTLAELEQADSDCEKMLKFF